MLNFPVSHNNKSLLLNWGRTGLFISNNLYMTRYGVTAGGKMRCDKTYDSIGNSPIARPNQLNQLFARNFVLSTRCDCPQTLHRPLRHPEVHSIHVDHRHVLCRFLDTSHGLFGPSRSQYYRAVGVDHAKSRKSQRQLRDGHQRVDAHLHLIRVSQSNR